MRRVVLVAFVSFVVVAASGCIGGSYRVEVLDRATGEPVTAVVEVAQVDSSDPPRELFWTRDVWVGRHRPAKISLWGHATYRMTLVEQPDLDAPFPDREEWPVIARWRRPLRPGDDANSWHTSDDNRFDLRLSR